MRNITLFALALAMLGAVGCAVDDGKAVSASALLGAAQSGTRWEYATLHYGYDFKMSRVTWIFDSPVKRIEETSEKTAADSLYKALTGKTSLPNGVETRCALLNAVGAAGWELVCHENREMHDPMGSLACTIEDWDFKRRGN